MDFACYPGEVHAIVGQNGAGKSTLMNIFAGVFPPSAGTMSVRGSPVQFRHPAEARRAGIRTVYQVPDLIPDLDVAQNLFLGEEPSLGMGVLSNRDLYKNAKELLRRLKVALPERRLVSRLSLSEQQLLTVARSLASPASVLILDEPTAPLGPAEAELLFGLIDECRAEGLAVLYISHRLEEIMAIADRVTVLRDGKVVATGPIGSTSQETMVSQMTGGQAVGNLTRRAQRDNERAPEPVLEVKGLSGLGLAPADLTVHAGEILGIGGLVGSGRSELLRLIFGAERPTAGSIQLTPASRTTQRPTKTRDVRPGDPRASVAAGIGFLTEERLKDGLAAGLNVQTNLSMTRLAELRKERELAEATIERLQVRGRPDQLVSELSGGNQQKVALGKWLKPDIAVLLIDEPTQGVDVSAKEEIHRQLTSLADEGVGILLVSSDIGELVALSDRVLVMREGALVKQLRGAEVTEGNVLTAAVG